METGKGSREFGGRGEDLHGLAQRGGANQSELRIKDRHQKHKREAISILRKPKDRTYHLQKAPIFLLSFPRIRPPQTQSTLHSPQRATMEVSSVGDDPDHITQSPAMIILDGREVFVLP